MTQTANLSKVKRSSGIELLKIIAIFLIVLSHVVQTLGDNNAYISYNDYIVKLGSATTDIKVILLNILRYSGQLGNTIFFICSAWFLLESNQVNKKKIAQMLLDIWTVSVLMLGVTSFLVEEQINLRFMLKQFFPTLFGNNWYLTCYILFYLCHTFLNTGIKQLNQRTMLKIILTMLVFYMGIGFIMPGILYSSDLILWVITYFLVAYVKLYLPNSANDIKSNVVLIILGVGLNILLILVTNAVGLSTSVFSNGLLRWNRSSNPLLIMAAIGSFNLARMIHFENGVVNRISKLSMLIYIIHENMMLRTYFRPRLWQFVYLNYGYEHLFGWVFLLTVIVFLFGLIASAAYSVTIQKGTSGVVQKSYGTLANCYAAIEAWAMRLH